MKTTAQLTREIDQFLLDTDARLSASRARGGGYVGDSGQYDPTLYDDANRAAQIRHDQKRQAREIAARKRAYALRKRRPTLANLGARIADLETLSSATQGEERARFERELEDARRDLANR